MYIYLYTKTILHAVSIEAASGKAKKPKNDRQKQ